MPTPKGMRVEVYRDASCQGDCTNGGVSSRHSRLTIIGEGVPEMDEPTEDAPAVYVFKKRSGGQEYITVRPSLTDGRWYMMGGNFCYCCDSRFRDFSPYPIPIHDRVE